MAIAGAIALFFNEVLAITLDTILSPQTRLCRGIFFSTVPIFRMMNRMEQNEPQPKPEDQLNLPVEVSEAPLPALPDYIRTEAFLERLGFFTPSSKRIKNIYSKKKTFQTRSDDGTRKNLETTISANHDLGLPITSDQDYFHAFEKILDEEALTDQNGKKQFKLPIRVSTRKLLQYAGKTENARCWKEARDWIRRMTLTGIEGAVYRKKNSTYDEGFVGTVFSQAILRGQKQRDGREADTNLIWPAPWYLSNYYHGHLRPVDHNFYQRLRKPISKALAPLLEVGFYASSGEPFKKKYSDLAKEFLLREEKHLSKIKEQLDPAHEELKRERLIVAWHYHQTNDKRSFIVSYVPGQKFFEDQEARRDRQPRPEALESPLSPDQLMTLEDLVTITGEPDNRRRWAEVIRSYPVGWVSIAVAETKQADLEHRISKTRGAYFEDALKRIVDRLTRPHDSQPETF